MAGHASAAAASVEAPEPHRRDLPRRSADRLQAEPAHDPENGVSGLDLTDIIDSLIIGPCANPSALQEAFIELLELAGFPDPAAVVRVSEIPLRL